jgi:hypothetical protein
MAGLSRDKRCQSNPAWSTVKAIAVALGVSMASWQDLPTDSKRVPE